MTLLTNLLGAVLIGFIAGLAGRGRLNASGAIFWKTGVCGGFTTFSTFSLERPDPAGAGTVAAGRELYAPEYGAVPAGGGPWGRGWSHAVTVAILPVCGFLPHVGWERVSITNNEEKREDVL